MKANWLVESDTWPETQRIITEVKDQGMKAIVTSRVPHISGVSYLDAFHPNDCVIYYGSLEFGEKLREEAPWVPGVIHNRKAFRCRNYYPALGKYLLAEDYAFVPYAELPRLKDFLYRTFGQDDHIFIRPDSGSKCFIGQLVEYKHFDDRHKHLGYYNLPPSELCVVSGPRNIDNEWRFFVADGKVIAGSQYRANERIVKLRCKDDKAQAFAQEVADERYDPDRVYVIDIFQTRAGTYRLGEIGCFSSAGLYCCDIGAIVKEVSRVALDIWESDRQDRLE